jgi:hypothetical protein
MMKSYLRSLESRPKGQLLAVLLFLVVAVGVIDYLTGVELSFSVLYLIPVAFGAWYCGTRNGVIISIICAISWYLADFFSSPVYSRPIVPYWNSLVMLGMFVTTALILSRLKHTIDRENMLARDVQDQLLPREIPEIEGFESASGWRPAQSVGGDYYDVIRLDDDSFVLCMGDVSGHGIPAAILMSNLQAAARMLSSVKVSPQEVCMRLNSVMLDNTRGDMFVTFFYGILDAGRKELVFTNAGHNGPLIVRRDGEVISLSEGGCPLGIEPNHRYYQGTASLDDGDLLILYTDGVLEVTDLHDEQFGEERFLGILKDHHRRGAKAVCDEILKAVSDFSRGNYQDDIALFALSVQTTEPAHDPPGIGANR